MSLIFNQTKYYDDSKDSEFIINISITDYYDPTIYPFHVSQIMLFSELFIAVRFIRLQNHIILGIFKQNILNKSGKK